MVNDRTKLLDTFRILPEYLQDLESSGDQPNFCDYGPQLTRSFKAFKVWLSFSVFGRKGISSAITKGFDLASFAEKIIEASDDLNLVSKAQMAVVCFRFGDRDDVQSVIADRISSNGYAMVSTTQLNNRNVLRLCTINPRTTESDIEETFNRIIKIGNEMGGLLS
jgi:glutamate/tyrosine decarboxylase-like PLP-dependent enzyme